MPRRRGKHTTETAKDTEEEEVDSVYLLCCHAGSFRGVATQSLVLVEVRLVLTQFASDQQTTFPHQRLNRAI